MALSPERITAGARLRFRCSPHRVHHPALRHKEYDGQIVTVIYPDLYGGALVVVEAEDGWRGAVVDCELHEP